MGLPTHLSLIHIWLTPPAAVSVLVTLKYTPLTLSHNPGTDTTFLEKKLSIDKRRNNDTRVTGLLTESHAYLGLIHPLEKTWSISLLLGAAFIYGKILRYEELLYVWLKSNVDQPCNIIDLVPANNDINSRWLFNLHPCLLYTSDTLQLRCNECNIVGAEKRTNLWRAKQ